MTPKEKFTELTKAWKEATTIHSNIHIICHHPAYKEIIDMDKEVVPFILEDIKINGPCVGFIRALWAITGENPMTHVAPGDVMGMGKAWLEWGEKNGLI